MAFYNNVIAGAAGSDGAGDFKIERSLRFNSGDSAYLSKTPSSAGNRKVWTLRFWVKRCKLGVKQRIFSAGTSGSAGSMIKFDASDRLEIWNYTGSYQTRKITNAVYRDVSA